MKLPPPVQFGRPRPHEREGLKGDRIFTEAHTELERDFWLKKSEWTLEEAIAISIGRDPRYVNWSAVEPYSSSSRHAYEYYKRREIVLSAHNQGHLPDPIPAADFIRWTLRIDLDCAVGEYELFNHAPSSMASAVMSQSTPGTQVDLQHTDPHLVSLLKKAEAECEEHKASAQELQARVQELEDELARAQEPRSIKALELSTFARLVHAMARDGYCYDPSKNKSTATKDIGDALDLVGLGLHEQTIRTYLRKADDEVQKFKPRKTRD